MIALRGMLPPVGNPIALRRNRSGLGRGRRSWRIQPGKMIRFYASGTAALGAAVFAARQATDGRHRVIMPAYACPALVAATRWAGCEPVLVDLEPDSPHLDASQVARELRAGDVAAVIAVHFLGLLERMDVLAWLCARHGTRLIEDSAQVVPGCGVDTLADATIFSFGRGKPLSVMGGGAVLLRPNDLLDCLPVETESEAGRAARWRQGFRVLAHNIALHPVAFRLIERIPGLEVGATRYKPLGPLGPVDRAWLELLDANYARYADDGHVEGEGAADRISLALRDLCRGPILDLPHRPAILQRGMRLLRYPLLMSDHQTRDAALAGMRRAGIGASSLYGTPLPGIEGMPEPVRSAGPFPHARDFSQRLLTLPTHEAVTEEHVNRMARILERVVGNSERDIKQPVLIHQAGR